MSLESELYSRLSGFSGLSDLVSTRIYPVKMPQNTALPAVVFQRITGTRQAAFGADTGDVLSRVQVDVFATSYKDGVRAVADQVRQALERYSSATISDIYIDNEFDDWDPETDIYRVTMDFRVWYKE